MPMTLTYGELRVLRVITVAQNKYLSYNRLALMADYSYDQIRRHTARLEQKGALRRRRASNLPYHYEVLCSF